MIDKRFENLSEEHSNAIIIKVLTVLEDKKYLDLNIWPFKDVSVDDVFNLIHTIYNSKLLIDNFVKCCLNNIESEKKYSLIDGLINLIYI